MHDLTNLQARYDEYFQELSTVTDMKRRVLLQKELARLSKVLDAGKELIALDHIITDIKDQLKRTDDAEMAELFKEELVTLAADREKKERFFEDLTIPSDEHDERSVFLEIRAGAGGQEASLFAADLVRMYSNYALKKNWRVALVDESFTDVGGIREATLHIQGDNVYGHLKFEAGVHRVQRVPKTETQGRVHTSTATVAVLPEAQEVDVSINPADLRIDVYRASGAGGQHVNKTDSAVRITHIPTGTVVACQEERSQHKNKAKAMKMLQSRILAVETERHASEIGKQRKEMIGRGMRSEKVRTYNFPQNRVTDHQADLTLKNLDYIIEGNLDEIVDTLRDKDREERRKLSLQ